MCGEFRYMADEGGNADRIEHAHVIWNETGRQTRIVYKLGFSQNHYTFALILLVKIVLCIKSH